MLHGVGQWPAERTAVAGRDHQHAHGQRGHEKESLGYAPDQPRQPEGDDDGRGEIGPTVDTSVQTPRMSGSTEVK